MNSLLKQFIATNPEIIYTEALRPGTSHVGIGMFMYRSLRIRQLYWLWVKGHMTSPYPPRIFLWGAQFQMRTWVNKALCLSQVLFLSAPLLWFHCNYNDINSVSESRTDCKEHWPCSQSPLRQCSDCNFWSHLSALVRRELIHLNIWFLPNSAGLACEDCMLQINSGCTKMHTSPVRHSAARPHRCLAQWTHAPCSLLISHNRCWVLYLIYTPKWGLCSLALALDTILGPSSLLGNC